MKQSDHPADVVSHFRARKKREKWGDRSICFFLVEHRVFQTRDE